MLCGDSRKCVATALFWFSSKLGCTLRSRLNMLKLDPCTCMCGTVQQQEDMCGDSRLCAAAALLMCGAVCLH